MTFLLGINLITSTMKWSSIHAKTCYISKKRGRAMTPPCLLLYIACCHSSMPQCPIRHFRKVVKARNTAFISRMLNVQNDLLLRTYTFTNSLTWSLQVAQCHHKYKEWKIIISFLGIIIAIPEIVFSTNPAKLFTTETLLFPSKLNYDTRNAQFF